ncbi:hypothetical protein QJQ45_014137, partial [Haematococcus lacustris]
FILLLLLVLLSPFPGRGPRCWPGPPAPAEIIRGVPASGCSIIMSSNMTVAVSVLGVYVAAVLLCGVWGAWLTWRRVAGNTQVAREHFMAGNGLGMVAWFFSMAATLFSGYSVSGIVNEAYGNGWTATRWIPAGVGVYLGFMWLAPRCHALGKERGYMTISELIFERYLPPRGPTWTAHTLRLLSFACLQLPVFTYLITQLRSVGQEVSVFTAGGVPPMTAVLVAAGVILACDLMGGMRAVAYTDVLQGVVLAIGSIVFLIIQQTQLGGLSTAWGYWADPANLTKPLVAGMQLTPAKVTTVAYADFVLKTTVAATMFPHLCQRMFCSRSATVMRRGLAAMTFTFFLVQLSSMIIGWVAISALRGRIKPGVSVFGSSLLLVAEQGTGQALASALLLASALCAMMSTADSALLAFSTMWVRDLVRPYLWRQVSEPKQLLVAKAMAMVGLAIGVGLSIRVLQTGTPDLSSLFSLQSVTPIHVAPSVWLGLHWRGLRAEPVLAGMVSGLGVTLGLVFSPLNLRRAAGDDMTASGLSSAWIGFCVNLFVTMVGGLAMQYGPPLLAQLRQPRLATSATWTQGVAQEEQHGGAAGNAATPASLITLGGSSAAGGKEAAHPLSLDIGSARDPLIHPRLQASLTLTPTPWHPHPSPLPSYPPTPLTCPLSQVPLLVVMLFTIPFCFPIRAPNTWVGSMASWAFVSLLLSAAAAAWPAGAMAAFAAFAYLFLWEEFSPAPSFAFGAKLPVCHGSLRGDKDGGMGSGELAVELHPTPAATPTRA